MDNQTYYPGYNEDIQMKEYEKIRKIINKKYNTKKSAMQIRSEFEKTFNLLFDNMMKSYSDRVFDILYVMMDCFNVSETKLISCLNKDNREKVRNFAINNFETYYYEKKETNKLREKTEKKGKKFFENLNISDLFE